MIRSLCVSLVFCALTVQAAAQLRVTGGMRVQLSLLAEQEDSSSFYLPGIDIGIGPGLLWMSPNQRLLARADLRGDFNGSFIILLGLGYEATAGMAYRLGKKEIHPYLGVEYGYTQRRYGLGEGTTPKYQGWDLWRLSLSGIELESGYLISLHASYIKQDEFWLVGLGGSVAVPNFWNALKAPAEPEWYGGNF